MSIAINGLLKVAFLGCIIVVILRAVVIKMIKELLWLFKLKKNGISTNGIIVGINEKKDLDNYKQYAKIIKFTTELEKEVIFESHDFFYIKPVIGQRVKVLYDRDDSDNVVEDFLKTVAFKFFLLLIVFVILIAITIVVFTQL
jgi:hypothetical protein